MFCAGLGREYPQIEIKMQKGKQLTKLLNNLCKSTQSCEGAHVANLNAVVLY